jgi:hypothetical protein
MWNSILLHSHMYTQQSPSHVWAHHHIVLLPLKRKPFFFNQFYGPFPRSLVGYVGFARSTHLCPYSMDHRLCPVPWIFAPYSRGPHSCSQLAPVVPTLRTLVKSMPWAFALHSKDVHPCSHLAPFYPYSSDLCPWLCHSIILHTIIISDTIC